MKPIILDMNAMSDSTEVYESRPNRFLIYTIYLVLFILVVAIVWMSLSKVEIVVKSNGIFKGSSSSYDISSGVTGSVKETYVENGQYVNEGTNKKDIEGQIALYQGNIDSISDTIVKYNEKIDKLNVTKQCVTSRNNTFDVSDSIYYSIVNSYISSYNYTKLQYDNKINEYQNQIDEYDNQIRNSSIEVDELIRQRDVLITTRDLITSEKMQALMNLELQQINDIEQQISGYNDTIQSLESNLTSAKLQLDSINYVDNEAQMNVAILSEKGNIAEEILSYEEKQRECEAYLKSYDIQNNSCNIKANISGYFYNSEELKVGRYIEEGCTIGSIYPEEELQYYAEVYVENKDIAGIKVGQNVKFEIAAYPSNKYGYFNGTVESISKDISVDPNTGDAYYLVKVKCNKVTLKGKDGKEVNLMNGMACQAKIVTDEKKVLSYILEKIDILD